MKPHQVMIAAVLLLPAAGCSGEAKTSLYLERRAHAAVNREIDAQGVYSLEVTDLRRQMVCGHVVARGRAVKGVDFVYHRGKVVISDGAGGGCTADTSPTRNSS